MKNEILKKKIIFTSLIFLFVNFSLVFVSANTPTITWEPPTPEGETTSNSWVYLNTSITDDNETIAFFDWNRDLLGYWNFENTNSTGVYDNSSYGNFATFEGASDETDNVTGKFGQAYYLTGTGYLDTHMDYSLTGSGESFSVFVWVKNLSSCSNVYVASQRDAAGSSDWILGYKLGGLWVDGQTISGENIICDGNWHLLGFTAEPGNPTYNSSLYIDGNYKGSDNGPAISDPGYDSVKLMANGWGGSNVNGKVDELMIWKRALSSEEIMALYNNTANRLYHNFTSLENGDYNYSAYVIDEDGNLNISQRNITIAISGPPETPTPEINSTDGTNFETQNLNCYDTLIDVDEDLMNATVRWYKDDVLNLTVDYNDSYSNGYKFNAVLDSGNISSGEIWKCSLRLFDGGFSEWGNSSDLTIIDSEPPNIIWEPPTPNNGDRQSETSVYLNTTITDGVGTSAFFDWNYSLLGYWSIDFSNSTGIFDNSSYNNFGIFTGEGFGEGAKSIGKYGEALEFDGDSDYINLGDTASGDYDAMTVEAWIKRTGSDSGWETALHRNDEYTIGSSVFFIGLEASTYDITATIGGGATGPTYQSGNTNIPAELDTWYHVVNSWDGTTARVYVDGKEILNYPLSSANFKALTATKGSAITRIGTSSSASNGYFFNGEVDEVKIYSRALSPEEINASYDNSLYKLKHNFTDLSFETYNYSAYAIDVGGNLNITETRKITISLDTCTAPGSGNWAITCSDNCSWSTDFNVPDNITITGTGILTWDANMSFTSPHWEIYKEDGCKFVINPGGSIR